jgi:hypothetical protein
MARTLKSRIQLGIFIVENIGIARMAWFAMISKWRNDDDEA